MKRPSLWLGTTLTLVLLGVGAMPASAASPALRTVSPTPVKHARALTFSRSLVSTAPGALSRSTLRSRLIPPVVPRFVAPTPTPTPAPTPTPTPTPDPYQISAQQILINQDRASNGGLAPLAWSPCLQAIALQNAQRIAAQGYLSHTNGPTLDMGCDPSYTTGGENIAYWSGGIDDVQANTMFMNSAPHRANILNGAYRFVGTAWVVAPNGYGYVAVEFAG
jgi:uncharacterized protein YkwD